MYGIKNFFKKYRMEIIIETVALAYIIIAWRLGWIDGLAINDGTFIVAALSVPLVIVRYIIDKIKSAKDNEIYEQEENNNFYYEILNKLLEISKDNMDHGVERSNLSVRLMQIKNIKLQGESLLDNDMIKTLDKAIKSTLVNLLTYDIALKQEDDNNIYLYKKQTNAVDMDKSDKEQINTIDMDKSNKNKSEKAFLLINQRISTYKDEIQSILACNASDIVNNIIIELSPSFKEKYNNLVFWNVNIEKKDLNKSSRELCIYYDCKFNNMSSFEAVFKHLIINPTFEFNNSTIEDIYKMYEQYSGDEEDKEIIKNANFIIDGNDVELSFDNNDNKCNDDFYSYFVIDSDMSRQEMKNKYGGEKTEVKVSANYKKPNDENFYSWFTITKKQLQNAKDKEVDLWKFIIDGDKKKIVIVMGNNGLEKLLKKKEKLSSSDAESDDYRYHFYFNAIKTKGDNYIIEDSRFAGGAFKLNARKVDFK